MRRDEIQLILDILRVRFLNILATYEIYQMSEGGRLKYMLSKPEQV